MGSRQEYALTLTAEGNRIALAVDGKELLACTDEESPYLTGSVGMSVTDGSHCLYRDLAVCGKE